MDTRNAALLPSRRISLKALYKGSRIWASLVPVRKLHICNGCKERIDIGQDAVVMRFKHTHKGIRTNHFLYHRRCFTEHLCPKLTELEQVPAHETKKGRVSEKVRRSRQRARRRERES